ncbi:MAG: FxsA family protein [Gammaproteobacteria bacterium]
MPVFLLFFALLVSVPLVELYVLIAVGRSIGAGTTIGLVILTAVLGAWLLRAQGLATLARARATMAAGELPAIEMVEGLILLLTGVLLLIPGFITDALGFLVLLPPVRRILARALAARMVVQAMGPGGPRPPPGAGPDHGPPGHHAPRTLEGDYRVEDDNGPR